VGQGDRDHDIRCAADTMSHEPVVLVPEKAQETGVSGLSLRHLSNTKTLDRSIHFAPVRRVISLVSRSFALEERGQSLVEFALILPILVFVLLGGTDIARAFAAQLAVQNGARAGAESAALDRTPHGTEAVNHAKQEMNRTPGINADNATITTTFTLTDGVTPCPPQTTTDVPGLSTYAAPCYANVRVQYTFRTVTPWPGLPTTFNFDRSTRYRRF
jgi:Flp pilus assembly protein TadG